MSDILEPENDSDPQDLETGARDSAGDDLDSGEETVVDAMTGEVTTLSAQEAQAMNSVHELVDGISPELFNDPYGEEKLSTSKEEFEVLLSHFSADFQEFKEGEIVKATVLKVTDAVVILEFGFKSEGAVALEEFKELPAEGEEVEVLLESLEDDDGVVVLSKKKADFLRVWEKIREAHDADRSVKGTLVRKIKGGVTVDLMGVDAFLPGSQIALRRVPNIEDLLGEVYKFRIIKLNKRRRNIVVSRRVILEGEREKKRETLVKELLIGQVREGQVKNITDFGAFIDLGGLDGLLHITDMSWGRVGHPSEVVDIGTSIDVKVLDIDWDRERISLGLKQLLPYPWTDIDKKYPVGARVHGKVVSITNYGAFVELERGVEGLVHISEMSWTRNIRHPSKVVAISEEIEAVVLRVDSADEKISLGMKQIEEDPWLALPAKYPTGTTLGGTVRNLTSFGAFVEIESGIDGLIHVSDMSWTRRVQHPSEMVEKGSSIKIVVLDVDPENKRISLGLKQLTDDPWPMLVERFAPAVESSGEVVRLEEDGLIVHLEDEVEGFVPLGDAGIDETEKLEEYYSPGDSVSIRVTKSDAASRKIALEITETPDRKSPEEIEEARTIAAALAVKKTEAESGPEDEPVGYGELKKKRKTNPKVESSEVESDDESEESVEEGEMSDSEPEDSETEAGEDATDADPEVESSEVESDDESEGEGEMSDSE